MAPTRATAAALLTLSVILIGYQIQISVAAAPPAAITVAQGTEPRSLDGTNDGSTEALNVYLAIYDALTARDSNGKLVPWLATSWRSLGDKGWEFSIRRGVRFHNGDPLTADDVIFTVQRILGAKDSGMTSKVRGITSVTKVDDFTVRFETSTAVPMMPASFTGMPIVPKRYVTESGAQVFADHPVGTGPFVFRKYVRSESVELEANPNYWHGKPKVERVTFLIMPEAASRVAALKTGRADIIRNLSPELTKAVESDKNLAIKSVITNRSINIMLDTLTFKPFMDRRVRQAFNYAIDVESIIRNILEGYGVRNPTMVPPGFVGYDASIAPYKFDPAKAQSLLREAGYPNGFELTFQSPNGRYLKDREVSEAVASYLTKVGVRTHVQTYEWGTYVTMYFNHKLGPIFLIGNGSFTQDASDNFDNIAGDSPYSWYSNAEIDQFIKQGKSTVNEADRGAIYKKVQHLVSWEAPILFMYTQKDIYGVNAGITWAPRRDEIVWLGDVTKR